MKPFHLLPLIDSPQIAMTRKSELELSRELARSLGRSAVEAIERGHYFCDQEKVDWSRSIDEARALKKSIAPEEALPEPVDPSNSDTLLQVANETTLGAAKRLVEAGLKPLALNFANGVEVGGGFLRGARAQEEALCRSSALYATLVDDPMYDYHRDHAFSEASDWVILSPNVPVFREDAGAELDEPWLMSFATCAAPYAPQVGQPRSRDLLKKRIHRVLSVARAYRYESIILGAWGCGAFENDIQATAIDFRDALVGDFAGAFTNVVFAITDWSEERRFLGPFRDVFYGVK